VSAVLDVSGLDVRFRTGQGEVHAVRGVDLQVAAGETLALVGESGCGKSTTARAIMGLVPVQGGAVRVCGDDVLTGSRRTRRARRRRMQIVLQDPYSSLDPRMTAVDSVVEPLAIHRLLDRRARRDRALELLDLVGIDGPRAAALPSALSGGQRQRVAIARALALEPAVLICDEAVSALDVSVQAQVLNLLADLQARLGVGYVFITHDIAVVSEIADRVAVMYLGRVVETGTRAEVLGAPRHPYTRALLSAAPHLRGSGDRVVLPGEPASALRPPPGCSFAPRCARALDVCRAVDPVLAPVGPDGSERLIACHNPEAS
jgi:oligopeptide transport system ATP-binding protein